MDRIWRVRAVRQRARQVRVEPDAAGAIQVKDPARTIVAGVPGQQSVDFENA
jgi:hypothetical protein